MFKGIKDGYIIYGENQILLINKNSQLKLRKYKKPPVGSYELSILISSSIVKYKTDKKTRSAICNHNKNVAVVIVEDKYIECYFYKISNGHAFKKLVFRRILYDTVEDPTDRILHLKVRSVLLNDFLIGVEIYFQKDFKKYKINVDFVKDEYTFVNMHPL